MAEFDPDAFLGEDSSSQNDVTSASGAFDPDAFLAKEAEKEKYAGVIGTGLASAAGFARGLSVGVSDLLLNQIGLEEEARKLKEYNPAVSTLSEIAGFTAPLVSTGGLGVLGAGVKGAAAAGKLAEGAALKAFGDVAAKTAGKQLMAKAAARGIGGAVEASLYGAGKYVSDVSLGEADLNAEKLASTVGLSALLGGVASSGLHVVGSGVKYAMKHAEPALKDLGSFLSGVSKETLDVMKKAPEAIDEIVSKADTVEGSLNQLSKEATSTYSDLRSNFASQLSKKIDDTLSFLNDAKITVPQQFDETLTKQGIRNWDDIFAEHQRRLLRGSKEGLGTVKVLSEKMDSAKEELLQWMRNEVGLQKTVDFGFKDLHLSAKELNALKTLYQNNSNYRITGEMSTAMNDLYKDLAQNANKIFEKAVSPRVRQLNQGFQTLFESESALKKFGFNDYGHDPEKFQRIFSANEQIWQNTKPYLKTIDSLLGTNYLEQAELGRAVKALYGSKGLSKSFTGRSLLVPGLGALAATPFGPVGAALGGLLGAAAQTPAGARVIAEGSVLAGDALQPILDKAIKYGIRANQYIPKNLVPAISAQIVGLSVLEKKIRQYDASVDEAINGLYQKGSGKDGIESVNMLPISGSEADLDKAQKMIETYLDNASSPEALTRAIENGLGETSVIAPNISKSLSQTMTNQMTFLANKAPKNPYSPSSQYYQDWKPSDIEMAKFARYIAATEKPLSVLDDLKANRVTPEGIEVLKNIYPRIYNDIVQRLMTTLSEKPTKIGYAKRLQMSDIFGIDFEPEIKPQNLALYQATFQKKEQPKMGSSKNMTLSLARPSQSQAIEMR